MTPPPSLLLPVITQARVAAAPRLVNSASVLSLRRDCRKFTRRRDLRGGLSRSVGSVSYLSLRKPLPGTSSVYRERVSIWASARLLRRSAFEILFVCSPKIKTRNFQIHSFPAPLRSTLLYIGWLHRHQMPARRPEDNWRREERRQLGRNERDAEGACTGTERLRHELLKKGLFYVIKMHWTSVLLEKCKRKIMQFRYKTWRMIHVSTLNDLGF